MAGHDATSGSVMNAPNIEREDRAFIEPTIAEHLVKHSFRNYMADVVHINDTPASNGAVFEVSNILVSRHLRYSRCVDDGMFEGW